MEVIDLPADLIPADVDLVGVDGNAFMVVGAVRAGLRKAGNPPEVLEQFSEDAMSGDYDHLLRVSMAYCGAFKT